MYKVYVGKCRVGQDPPVTFFFFPFFSLFLLFEGEKRSSYVETY